MYTWQLCCFSCHNSWQILTLPGTGLGWAIQQGEQGGIFLYRWRPGKFSLVWVVGRGNHLWPIPDEDWWGPVDPNMLVLVLNFLNSSLSGDLYRFRLSVVVNLQTKSARLLLQSLRLQWSKHVLGRQHDCISISASKIRTNADYSPLCMFNSSQRTVHPICFS